MEINTNSPKDGWIRDAVNAGNIKYIEYSAFENPTRFAIGGTGEVLRAYWKDNSCQVALKFISLPQADYHRQLFTEVCILINFCVSQ